MRTRLRSGLRIAIASVLMFSPLETLAASFPINDENPSRSVPSIEAQSGSPLEFGYWLMEVTDRAVQAQEAKDLARAAQYYEAIALAAPQRALAFSKLCQIYLTLRETDVARPHCEKAITTGGATTRDFERYLALLLTGPGDLSTEQAGRIKEVVAHVQEQGSESASWFELECKAGVRLEDETFLERCTSGLLRVAPDDTQRLPFEFALAFLRKDSEKAKTIVEQARNLGLAPDEIARMEELEKTLSNVDRRTQLWIVGALLVILGGATVAAIALGRKKGAPAIRTPAGTEGDRVVAETVALRS